MTAPPVMRVLYRNKLTSFADLSILSGIHATTLYSRWRSIGSPHEIPESMVSREKFLGRDYITLDGRRTTLQHVAAKFGVPYATARAQSVRHGGKLLTQHFPPPPPPPPVAPKKKAVGPPLEDRSPGWLERREFPDAGKRGFCKHQPSRGVSSELLSTIQIDEV